MKMSEKIFSKKFVSVFAIGIVLACLTFSVSGIAFEKTAGDVKLSDGDTMVLAGDSITHQCLYTQYIEDYYYTRYPDNRIHIYNAGVSGDKAGDVLVRFKEDIAKFKPKYVSVLIGMNDGEYTRFEDSIFNTYRDDMLKLIERIDDIGAKCILITPTMYDLRGALIGDGEEGMEGIYYNAVLGFYGAWVRQQANQRGLGFVNMYEPLNRLTRQQRQADAEFTMIGEEGIHPTPNGQIVMATAFLRDIGAKPVVSAIDINRTEDGWRVEATNGEVSDIGSGKLSFKFKAKSLPWVVPEEAQPGYELCGAKGLSRETVRVIGLKPGEYVFKIDGQTIGRYSYLQLVEGIELQDNPKTPQYQQAMKIALLNKKRNDESVRPLRDLWLEMKIKRYSLERPEELEEAEDITQEQLEKWEKEFRCEVTRLCKKAEGFEKRIYEINKPEPYKYEIVEVE